MKYQGNVSDIEQQQNYYLKTECPSWGVRRPKVLSNLISNAIKFSKEGGYIKLSVESDCIKVIDNGCGIGDNALPTVFDDDVLTTSLGTKGEYGFALGLPYCRKIIELHGGILDIFSEEGKGSEFFIKIP